jgi:hypothetical protein
MAYRKNDTSSHSLCDSSELMKTRWWSRCISLTHHTQNQRHLLRIPIRLVPRREQLGPQGKACIVSKETIYALRAAAIPGADSGSAIAIASNIFGGDEMESTTGSNYSRVPKINQK